MALVNDRLTILYPLASPIQCDICISQPSRCGGRYASVAELRKHVKSKHPAHLPMPVMCSKCSRVFDGVGYPLKLAKQHDAGGVCQPRARLITGNRGPRGSTAPDVFSTGAPSAPGPSTSPAGLPADSGTLPPSPDSPPTRVSTRRGGRTLIPSPSFLLGSSLESLTEIVPPRPSSRGLPHPSVSPFASPPVHVPIITLGSDSPLDLSPPRTWICTYCERPFTDVALRDQCIADHISNVTDLVPCPMELTCIDVPSAAPSTPCADSPGPAGLLSGPSASTCLPLPRTDFSPPPGYAPRALFLSEPIPRRDVWRGLLPRPSLQPVNAATPHHLSPALRLMATAYDLLRTSCPGAPASPGVIPLLEAAALSMPGASRPDANCWSFGATSPVPFALPDEDSAATLDAEMSCLALPLEPSFSAASGNLPEYGGCLPTFSSPAPGERLPATIGHSPSSSTALLHTLSAPPGPAQRSPALGLPWISDVTSIPLPVDPPSPALSCPRQIDVSLIPLPEDSLGDSLRVDASPLTIAAAVCRPALQVALDEIPLPLDPLPPPALSLATSSGATDDLDVPVGFDDIGGFDEPIGPPRLNVTFRIDDPVASREWARPAIPCPPVNPPPAVPDPGLPGADFLGALRRTSFQSFWIPKFLAAGRIDQLNDLIKAYSDQLALPPRPRTRNQRRRARNVRPPPAVQPAAHGNRAPARTATFYNSARGTHNPEEAARLQRDFNLRPGRAVEKILSGGRAPCDLPPDQLESHFTKIYEEKSHSPDFPFASLTGTDPVADELLSLPFSLKEVADHLARTGNTAPGPDSIPYSVIKTRDPGGLILTTICRAVQRLNTIPDAWRKANIILAHKSGDAADISNWRPIALMNTMGKVFCSCLGDRLSVWANTNNLLSPSQKGFREFEGCLEHNFISKHLLDRARATKSNIFLAWLDLENAFGAVPHSLIFEGLKSFSLPDLTLKLISDLYTDARCKIQTSSGLTNAIPMRAGVRQGCPLSSILFNLTIEHIIRHVQSSSAAGVEVCGKEIKILAYADDILLIAPSHSDLQTSLNAISSAADLASLKFKPRKCASLAIKNASLPRAPLHSIFYVQGSSMPHLTNGEAYKYLGVQVGFDTRHDYSPIISGVITDIQKIHDSLLAPWQMLRAIRGHILPRVEFLFRNLAVQKADVKRLDKELKATVKSIMNLPQRADANLVHVSVRQGGAGILSCADVVDLDHVTYAVKILGSRDPFVKEVALSSLADTVRTKSGVDPTDEACLEFLNGELPFRPGVPGLRTTWSAVRQAVLRLKPKIFLHFSRCQATGALKISMGEPEHRVIVTDRSKKFLFRELRAAFSRHYLSKIAIKPDQGKTCIPVSLHPASSAFIGDGSYHRFCDWRFIHRARLGVLSLNGTRRWGNNNKKCRRCGAGRETIPHVLNHCTSHSRTWQLRHNEIQDRLVRAIPSRSGTVKTNCTVPESSLPVRPDIHLRRPDGSYIFVDVTVPFEDREEAFSRARFHKEEKYRPLIEDLANSGIQAEIHAIIVGALGSWDPSNDAVLGRLGVSRKYATMMRKLMCARTIAYSRNIYVSHLTGTEQTL